MMKRFVFVFFSILVLSACTLGGTTKQIAAPQMLVPTPTLVRGDLTWEESLLVSQLSKEVGVSVNDIMVAEVSAVDWRDDCLNLKLVNTICHQVVTPGYLFILVANDKQYEYHTNREMTEILLVDNK